MIPAWESLQVKRLGTRFPTDRARCPCPSGSQLGAIRSPASMWLATVSRVWRSQGHSMMAAAGPSWLWSRIVSGCRTWSAREACWMRAPDRLTACEDGMGSGPRRGSRSADPSEAPLADVENQARSGDADLALVTVPGCGSGRGRVCARHQVGQHQVPGARFGSLPTLLACAGQGAA
jgi:hypothetical protein